MEKPSCIFVLLSLFVATLCSDGPTKCSMGSKCFPYGPVPKDVTHDDIVYYCCPESNRTKHIYRPPGAQSYNCSCSLDLTLEAKIQKLARDTRHLGRMCVREDDCEGAVMTIMSERYKFCCFLDTVNSSLGSGTSTTAKVLDTDNDEFEICRCTNTQVPIPDPKAYVVPPVPRFNSTGEVCSYDEGCKNRPTLKCESHLRKNVTFCCYGSRGLVTQNDGNNNFTRCTCTDEVFGARCAALPIAIEDSTMPCLTDPGSNDNVNCTGTGQDKRCCAYNMVPEVTCQSGGTSSCTCHVPGKSVDDTSEGIRHGSRLNGVILCALATLLFKHM